MTQAQKRVAAHRTSGYAAHPDYRVDFEVSPRLVRVVFAGEEIARTTAALVVRETAHTPVYYFPQTDVRMDLMTRTDHSTHCPFKGDAAYWTLQVGDRVAENVVWSYPGPYDEVTGMKDYVAFYWSQMDGWFEEDEEIFVHPRDPYKRIDAIPSSRSVEVIVGGKTIAQSTNAHFLFETGLPTRYYLPRGDVDASWLTPSQTQTRCPYKGTASYYNVTVDDQVHEDLVWYYPEPIAECPKIKDLLCFFNEHVEAIKVDGEIVPNVKTPWSPR